MSYSAIGQSLSIFSVLFSQCHFAKRVWTSVQQHTNKLLEKKKADEVKRDSSVFKLLQFLDVNVIQYVCWVLRTLCSFGLYEYVWDLIFSAFWKQLLGAALRRSEHQWLNYQTHCWCFFKKKKTLPVLNKITLILQSQTLSHKLCFFSSLVQNIRSEFNKSPVGNWNNHWAAACVVSTSGRPFNMFLLEGSEEIS